MIDPRRRELAPRNQSITGTYRKADAEVEFDAWVKGLKGGSRYSFFGGKPDENRSGAWARRATWSNYGGDGEEEFRWLAKEEVDSDTPSPKLWEHEGSPVASRRPATKTSPVHHQLNPRAQTIARYRQEMMDLARDAPESAYELSLKDLVEMPRTAGRMVQEIPEEDKGAKRGKAARKKRGTRRMSRSDSMDAGVFLLKMFLPFSLSGKGGKKSKGGKVSPRPTVTAADGEKGADGDWWNSSSSGSSGSSGSRKLSGCYSFLTRSKSGKIRGQQYKDKLSECSSSNVTFNFGSAQ